MSNDSESQIIHRKLETDVENPGVQIAEIVQDIEEKEATDLSTIYECVDGVLDHVFSTPPSPQAQMQIEFSYESYRITVHQDGEATFVKTN
ncbi:HalOD1 output domain-containing protein [Halobaculum halobium]|uniref:HalOD1 output domain-containing protein n=1 Tax=Halobaculum halobium TaxID=3032281 RepID=A0ABD5TGN6_9EURY|nr:HalOD1 output domain-containing protein [Halobaculum sp. SYNS20]